jgi:LacI family repressor for deo operon, udp, cdd, tsx, nupC, and nupG
MATIKDVADKAGVSRATVSRVLMHPEIVAARTRDHVLAVVRQLGYAPNSVAASLRTTRTNKIIVTVPNISNSFFSSVIRGAEEAAQKAGYAVLLGDTRDDRRLEEQYASMLLRHEADGLIFLGHRLPDVLSSQIDKEGKQAPIVNGCEFSPQLRVSSAHIDNSAAAQLAMETLYDLGHRDVALLTGPLKSPLSRDRLEGAKTAARARGLVDRLHVMQGDFSMSSGKIKTTELINRKVGATAMFCFSDEMAVGALAALRRAGMVCPRDMSLIGFDDIPMARFVEPTLTTIRQPMEQIGRCTVELLLNILAGRQTTPVSVTLPHKLVVRGSAAPPPNPPS